MSESLIPAAQLRQVVTELLCAVDVPVEDAAVVADVLVAADLRGHESHGIARLEAFYIRRIQSGQIDPQARTVILRERAATLVLDASHGLGHPAGKRAMEMCIERARTAGSCVATVRRSNHFGIAGYYAMMALPHDMIGLCCTNSLALVVPTGGRSPVIGTNPIAFAAPAGRHQPFVLDMATSVVPLGKVEVKARRDEPLPLGWAVDDRGAASTDAAAVMNAIATGQSGGLMPLGGVDAGHKGYGLGAMVDILCGVLAGARAGLAVYGDEYAHGSPADVGHIFAAIDLDAFGEVAAFKEALDGYIDQLHQAPRAEGVERIQVAGEPEYEQATHRERYGVPVLESVLANLRALGSEFGVTVPF